MKKHVFKLLTTFVLLSAIIQPAVSAAASSSVTEVKSSLKMSVNGTAVKFKYGEPVIENERSLIPVRDLLVNLGVSDDNEHIIWDAKTRAVTIIQGDITLSLAVDSKDILKNGEVIKQLETPAKMVTDRVYLPARAVAEALGFIVTYDEKLQNIVITTEKPVNSTDIEIKPEAPTAVEVITPDAKDKTAPTVVGVLSSTGYKVEVIFSEPVDKVTAENIASYAITENNGSLSSLSVVSAIQGTDRSKVTLTTAEQNGAKQYTLVTSKVTDDNHNIIITAPIKFLSSGRATAGEVSGGATAVEAIEPTEHIKALSRTTVEVDFGRELIQAFAENSANYLIKETYGPKTELIITEAKLQPDGMTVILTTGEQAPSILFSLMQVNLADSSGNKIDLDLKKLPVFVSFAQ